MAEIDEVAVVTGAGRGFGREIARLLIMRGYAVLVTDVDARAAEEAAEALGHRAWAMPLDVRDPEAHRAAAAATGEWGRLRVWVNNAGVLRTEKAWEHTDDEVRLMVEANLLGVIWGSRAAVETMRRHGVDAHIINLASLSAFGPVPGISVYAATKHGVLGFSTSLQGDLEAARLPIRVHAVCPDAARTDMVREHADEPDAAIIFSAPRLLDATEVAEQTVALLDSETLVLTIPRSRGVIAKGFAPFPRASLKLMGLFRRVGDRKRRRDPMTHAAGS
jgi:NAD(P)-dependent dehydrogenase (short-subunit alcohol dehydrogenase family)